MLIDDIMAELERVKVEHGNIEVTCTGSLLPDGYSRTPMNGGDIYETTIENFRVFEVGDKGLDFKRVRVYL